MTTEFADLVARLDEGNRELFEERAAVREYDAGFTRAHAECLALLDVLRSDPLAFTGVSLLRAEQGSAVRYVLVADRGAGPASTPEASPTDLRSVVQQLGGVAELLPAESLRKGAHLM